MHFFQKNTGKIVEARSMVEARCAAAGLALVTDDVRGRHLIATRAFSPGDVVLAEPSPVACVLHESQVRY